MVVHILVIGAGAVGCFYASKLRADDTRVYLVCRSNYAAVRDGGVQLRTHSFGDYHFQPDGVFASVDEAARATADTTGGAGWQHVIMATKALSPTTGMADAIRPLVSEGTSIALLHNGVNVEAPYRTTFPNSPVVSGVTAVSSELAEPNVVMQFRWTRITLGPFINLEGSVSEADAELNERATRASRELADIWTKQGIRDAEAVDARALQMTRWGKVMINSALNSSGVLSGAIGAAQLLRNDDLREHILACMYEVVNAVPKVLGAPLPETVAPPEKVVASVARNAGAVSSMVQDWRAHRQLELDAILGEPIRIAKQHGAEMPRLQTMYALLRSADRIHRGIEHPDDLPPPK